MRVGIAVILVGALAASGCGGAAKSASVDGDASGVSMLRVEGDQIVDGSGTPVRLRGVAFGNQVWLDRPYPRKHHDERDYGRVRSMGMNTVRFYMHYTTFEDDGFGIQPQLSFLFVRPMTRVALRGQDRLDIANKVDAIG